MDTQEVQTTSRRRRQGQTLAEFAITLPTLLIIMFGIIEFGRIFQAWVTLQNSARTAARYASTGQYFEDQFPMQTILNEAAPSDPTGFIPCVDDGPEDFRTYPTLANHAIDQRGTKTTVKPNGIGDPAVVNVYSGGLESLFATWYDGKNCDPRDADDQDRRKDMARILSILLEARRGAGGLAIEDNQWTVPSDPLVKNNVQTNWNQLPWFEGWQTVPKPPRSDQRYWFNVVVCSDRSFVYKDSTAKFQIDNGSGVTDTTGARFIPYQGDQTLLVNNTVVAPEPWAPACLLNENPSPLPPGGFSNAGQMWMDPGAPEDTVFVTVTFNHPLITPLGIAPFIPLQARRSAIVETFRTSGNRSGVIFGPPIGSNAPTPTYTPTPTQTYTPSPVVAPTRTATATATVTKTPLGPFTCSLLSMSDKRLSGNQFQIDIQNDNAQATFVSRVQITWPNIPAFAQMGLTQMSLNTVSIWTGDDRQVAGTTTTTDTNTKPGNPPFSNSPISDRQLEAQNAGTFAATFNGPPLLATYVSANQYAITITVDNPLNPNTPCILTSVATVSTATPTVAGQPSATRTPTPDCASSLIAIRFNSFDNFGIVRYDILSQRTTTSTLVSFNINWQKYVNSQRLVKVSLVAPPGNPGSVVVWDSGNVNQDSTPPTNSKTEGTWLTNFTIPAGAPGSPSITPIYFDFEGIYRYDDYTSSTNPRYGGPSDFNYSDFELTCGTPGGAAGTTSGGQPTGHITPVNNPTPTTAPTQGPTNTPKPTNSPAPTLPPSKTPTKGPPTNTKTPKPPTATPQPSFTTTGPQAPPTANTGN